MSGRGYTLKIALKWPEGTGFQDIGLTFKWMRKVLQEREYCEKLFKIDYSVCTIKYLIRKSTQTASNNEIKEVINFHVFEFFLPYN